MPDLRARSLAVIVCCADAAALDALVPVGHASRSLRTCADETLVVATPEAADTVERELTDRIAALDPDALVLDVSDGWSGWSLHGADALRAFSYLSALEMPQPGDFVLGDVARIAAVVLGEDDGVTILVPAYWSEHIRERVIHDARATEVQP